MKVGSNEFDVYLRGMNIGDSEEIARLFNDPELIFNISNIGKYPFPYKKTDGMEFVEFAVKTEMSGKELHLCIVSKNKDKLLGVIGFAGIDLGFSAEMGYWIGKEYRRKGYGKAAINIMAGIGFDKLGLYKIDATVFLDNTDSSRLLESCGFKKNGVIRADGYTTKYKKEFIDFLNVIKQEGTDIDINSLTSKLNIDRIVVESWIDRLIFRRGYGINEMVGDVPRDSIRFNILKTEYSGKIISMEDI